MSIWTTAASVAKHDVCDGGEERTAEALAKRGLTMDDRVSMQVILDDLGLCDALFSFCEVEKKSREEATLTLRRYILHVAGYALRFLSMIEPDKLKALSKANKAINKRCEGIPRPALSRKSFVEISRLHEKEADAMIKHWLNVYRILLSPKPDHIVAVHGTIALLEGCEIIDMQNDMRTQLVATLHDLLGTCPMMEGEDG